MYRVWKSAKVIPAPKFPRPRSVQTDLRSISLFPSVAKVLESIIGQWLLSVLDRLIPTSLGVVDKDRPLVHSLPWPMYGSLHLTEAGLLELFLSTLKRHLIRLTIIHCYVNFILETYLIALSDGSFPIWRTECSVCVSEQTIPAGYNLTALCLRAHG